MKAVALSIILLIGVLVLTVLNSSFVNSRIEKMKSIAMEISENGSRSTEAVDKLYSIWEDSRALFSLSVGLREIDRVTENLLSLREACSLNNDWEIRQKCVLLCNALDDIARYEHFSIESIL